MNAAERIQPEQDVADKIAEKWVGYEGGNAQFLLAKLIRSTLREEATEGWMVHEPGGTPVLGSGHINEVWCKKAFSMRRDLPWLVLESEGYTVRRVLVLEVSDGL